MLIQFTQETQVALQETTEEDALTDQTSAKMNSTLSYDNEGFILDLTSSSDNIAEVRASFQCFLILFTSFKFSHFRSPRDAGKTEKNNSKVANNKSFQFQCNSSSYVISQTIYAPVIFTRALMSYILFTGQQK